MHNLCSFFRIPIKSLLIRQPAWTIQVIKAVRRPKNTCTRTMASQSGLKIHYFDEDGRAEVSRLVLVYAGKPFEDVRISFDGWPKVKSKYPLKQVPVLEIDGTMYPQSLAIAAYLAKENGLYGSTNLDGLNIDVVAETVLEFRMKASRHYYEQDASKKSALAVELTKVEAPRYLDFLEKKLKDNGREVMVGSNISLADIIVYDLFRGALSKFTEPNVDSYPNLKKLVEKILNTDNMKKYALGER